MSNKKCGIYKITNKTNGKSYIGQSIHIYTRWTEHKYEAFAGCSKKKWNYPLYKAFRKYGVENFDFEILKECKKDELNDLEIYYIEYFNSYTHSKNGIGGYNQTIGGEATTGYEYTEEIKLLLSEISKERFKGVPKSEEHKRKLSESKKGTKHSDKTKVKMSEKRKRGKHPLSLNVECDGIVFDCIKDCAEFYSANYTTMTQWLSGYRNMPVIWVERGLSYC